MAVAEIAARSSSAGFAVPVRTPKSKRRGRRWTTVAVAAEFPPAVAVMEVKEGHLNGGNVCQGGALFTLADLAIAALMNCSGQLTFGISNSLMFVSSARLGDVLRAEATMVADHHKIPAVEVVVTNQEGRTICHVTGMGYRKPSPLPQH